MITPLVNVQKFNTLRIKCIVFITGMVVMAFELTASRILAPFFGTTIIVWTSIIGIILASLSVGYYIGGITSDRQKNMEKILSIILFLSAVFMAGIAASKELVLTFIQTITLNVFTGTLLSTMLLFAPVNIVLGMILPLSTKVMIRSLKTSGTDVGKLYALSTIGSILGTFAAGFYLIPHFGNTTVLFIFSIIYICLSLLTFPKNLPKIKVFILVFLIGSIYLYQDFQKFSSMLGFIDVDSQYNRIWVYDTAIKRSNRPIRYLMTEGQGRQGAKYLDNPEELVFPPLKFFHLAEHFQPIIKQSLLIGGGTYSFSRDYLKRYSTAYLDVVEVDPEMTRISGQYFDLVENPRLSIIHEDGRSYLHRNLKTYDAIYLDASTTLSPPFYLLTREAVQKMYDSLTSKGTIASNLITPLTGNNSFLFQSVFATFSSVFPQVFVFPVFSTTQTDYPQNIVLLAWKANDFPLQTSVNPEIAQYLKKRWIPYNIKGGTILTDDFAPIEFLTLSFGFQSGKTPIQFLSLYQQYFSNLFLKNKPI